MRRKSRKTALADVVSNSKTILEPAKKMGLSKDKPIFLWSVLPFAIRPSLAFIVRLIYATAELLLLVRGLGLVRMRFLF